MLVTVERPGRPSFRVVVNNHSKKRRFPMKQLPARVIAMTSGKGGVGKTNLAVNLGMALTQAGKRVLILDADLGLANVNILLGFETHTTLAEVLDGKASLDDVIVQSEHGFDIIPAASGIPEIVRLSDEARVFLMEAIEGLANRYDYLLVDTGAGIGDNVMYFNVAAEEIIVVVDDEPTSLTDAYALIKVMSSHHGRKEFSIIANRTDIGKDGRGVYAQLAAACDKFLHTRLRFIGSVRFDSSVPESVRSQEPVLARFPSSKASVDIVKIADKLMASESERNVGGGMQFFFRSLLSNGE